MSQPLRLESIGDFLQKIIDHYTRNLRLFVEILLFPAVVVTISGLWIEQISERLKVIAEMTDAAEKLAQMVLPMTEVLVCAVAVWIIQCASLGAIAAAVQELQRGGSISVGQAWRRAARHLAGIVTLGVAYPTVWMVGSGIACLIFLIPLAVLAALVGQTFVMFLAVPLCIGCMVAIPLLLVRYALAIPVMVFETTGTLPACRRSALMTHGSRLFLVIALLVCVVASSAVAILFQGPFMAAQWAAGEGNLAIPLHVGQAIAGTVGSALGMPIPMLALCLFYVELRNREQTLTIGV